MFTRCSQSPLLKARQKAIEVLDRQINVVMLPTPWNQKTSHSLCLWLNQSEFQAISDPLAETVLESWVSHLRYEHLTEHSCA